jgi:PAS domain S-box-containing protein
VILCASVGAACLTLAAMHSVVWLKDRSARAHLAFAVLASGSALFTWTTLLMMRAASIDEFARALWWTNLAVFWLVAASVAFIRVYFPRSRGWLGHLAWVLRAIAMTAHALRWPNSDFDTITALNGADLLGERVAVAAGVPSVWLGVGQLSLAVLFVFIADATVSAWRRGDANERRRAKVIGLPMAVYVGMGVASAQLIFSGAVTWPHLEFIPFMGILCAMGYQLSGDVLRAARLSKELLVSEAALRESERRMTMAAEAARLGLWIHDLRDNGLWLTAQCRKILGFTPDEPVTYTEFAERVHPDDRARADRQSRRAVHTGMVQEEEHRVVHPDASVHIITSRLAADLDESGRPYRIRGVCIDVTDQRKAEQTAHELSGRLINAQEDERRRIARDLHDDFNQRLSVLSVELELLGRGQPTHTLNRFGHLASQIRQLSSEVHNLAYQLHPAKLDQLGLETALRSWCRDVSRQSPVAVTFSAENVPAHVPPDTALCVYRITQEALRNVVRHSQSPTAQVRLRCDGPTLRLTVADAGRGFDARSESTSAGLGLLSMRERAHLLHGTMAVKSVEGQGSEIGVELPLQESVSLLGPTVVRSEVQNI